jgi:ubiquinone/menaquinone biosynthesis C-methylase UbiE
MSIPFAQLSFPELYEQALVQPLFRPFAEAMIDELVIKPGDRVLDVACGTGIVARLAYERARSQVVGIDLSPPMVALARQIASNIEFREGDATALPLQSNEVFDVVTCHQGFQFFPNRLAAARQMRRALAPGGRAAVATWCNDEEYPFLRALRAVVERYLGSIADRRHSLHNEDELANTLRAGGFEDVRVSKVHRWVRFADGAVFVRMNAMALIGMSANGKDMTDVERDRAMSAIMAESQDVLRSQSDGPGLAYELGTNIAIAA